MRTVIALLTANLLLVSGGLQEQGPASSAAQDLRQGTEAIRVGHYEEAERYFKSALNASPDDPTAHMELGVAELRMGRAPEAVDELKQAIKLVPDLPGAHLFLGIAYAQMHRADDCVAALQQELQLNPKNSQAYLWWGVVELQDGHPEKATEPLDHAAELAPNDLNVLEYRGKAHSDVAFASYARMAVLAPDSWHVHRVQAQMYADKGLHKEAIEELQLAIKQVPNNSDLYEELGAEYRKSSQLELAQQAYAKELELSPNNPIAKYNLAKIDIETNRTSEGLDLLHKVNANYDNVPATYFYLGVGEFDSGHVREALIALEKARAMHPEPALSPRIEYELSRVYKRLGRTDDSNRAIHEYTRLKAENAKLNPQVLSAISNGFEAADAPTPEEKSKN